MKNKEYILKYLNNELSEDEMQKMVKLINSDDELKNLVEKYKNKLNLITDFSIVEENELYFLNLKNRIEYSLKPKKEPKVSRVRLVYVLPVILIASLLFVSYPLKNDSLQNIISEFEDSEIEAIINEQMYLNFNENDFAELIDSELYLNETLGLNEYTDLEMSLSNFITTSNVLSSDENYESLTDEDIKSLNEAIKGRY